MLRKVTALIIPRVKQKKKKKLLLEARAVLLTFQFPVISLFFIFPLPTRSLFKFLVIFLACIFDENLISEQVQLSAINTELD